MSRAPKENHGGTSLWGHNLPQDSHSPTHMQEKGKGRNNGRGEEELGHRGWGKWGRVWPQQSQAPCVNFSVTKLISLTPRQLLPVSLSSTCLRK